MAGRRVLLIDDDAHVVRLLALLMEHAGFEVTTASGAHEGIELAQKSAFDAVVLDYEMPDLNGAEVLMAIRKAQPDIGAFFSSGKSPPELEEEAQRQKAVALKKPYRVVTLIAALERFLGNQG
jgi:CheY-like chemotaxis protein